jgi:linoleoyl-CoA desaturase
VNGKTSLFANAAVQLESVNNQMLMKRGIDSCQHDPIIFEERGRVWGRVNIPRANCKRTIQSLIIFVILTLFCLLLRKHSSEVVMIELTLLGFFLFLGGTHVLHEGTHGNLSRRPAINRGFVMLYEWIACFSADQYRLRHLSLHHAQPNVGQLDNDLHAKDLLRFSPAFPHRPYHRFQFIYAPLLYSLGIIQIAWIEDFKRLLTSRLAGHPHAPWRLRDIVRQVSAKLTHFAVFIGIPLTLYPTGSVLLAYLYVYLIGSLGIALIFQVTHVNTMVEFPSVDKTHLLKKDWYEHQIATAINYAPESQLALFLTGGVNLQIEHHLFPDIPANRYAEVGEKVKEITEKYGQNYNSGSFFNHFTYVIKRIVAFSFPDPIAEKLFNETKAA